MYTLAVAPFSKQNAPCPHAKEVRASLTPTRMLKLRKLYDITQYVA
jgi:hypothetical protein